MRENKLRRSADRQGYKLSKSRSRDTGAVDYGLYALIDTSTGGAVNPAISGRWLHSWTLDEVEEWLGEKGGTTGDRLELMLLGSGVDHEDAGFAADSIRLDDRLPSIHSKSEYRIYKAIYAELTKFVRPHDTQSAVGMLTTSIGAKIIEWDES